MPKPFRGENQQAFMRRASRALTSAGKPATDALRSAVSEWNSARRGGNGQRKLSAQGEPEVNPDCVSLAFGLIRGDKVDHKINYDSDYKLQFTPPANPDPSTCIAVFDAADPAKQRFALPIVIDGLVSRTALQAAQEECWKCDYPDVQQSISSLLSEIYRIRNGDDVRYLSAPTGEFKQFSVTTASKFPATKNSLPCFYFWKDVIEPGHYVHPVDKWELDVESKDITQLHNSTQQILANGVPIPILKDHKQSADNTLGYIVDSKIEDDGRLYQLHQFLGEAARDTGLKNHVSVGIDDDFHDGNGRGYGLATAHVAATPTPVVGGQGEFLRAASRVTSQPTIVPPTSTQTKPTGGPMSLINLSMADDQWQKLLSLVPGLKDATDDSSKIAALVGHLTSQAAIDDVDAGGAEVIKSLSRSEIATKAVTHRKNLSTENQRLTNELSTAQSRVTELAKQVPQPLDEANANALISAITVKKDFAVTSGYPKSAMDMLFSRLVKDAKGKTNTLGLSAAANPTGDGAIALVLFDILASAKPVAVDSKTHTQELSRATPDGDDEKTKREKEAHDAVMAGANGTA